MKGQQLVGLKWLCWLKPLAPLVLVAAGLYLEYRGWL